MEKRTRLAILLIALIMGGNLIYTAYTQKQRLAVEQARRAQFVADSLMSAPPGAGVPAPVAGAQGASAIPTPAPGATPTGEAPVAASIPPGRQDEATSVAQATGFPTATEADGGDLVIETPLQRIVLSRRGGVVRSLQLTDFDVYGDGPVDLVPPRFLDGDRAGLGLTLRTPAGEVSLDGSRFDPAPGNFGADGVLRLAAGDPPRDVTLRCAAAAGGAIVKRFTFHPDRHLFDLALAAEPGPGLPRIDGYTLEWTTGMPVTEQSAREDETRIRVVAAIDEELVKKKSSDFRKTESITTTGAVRFACLQSKYFTVALVPATPVAGTAELVGQSKSHWIGVRLTQPAPWRAGTGADTYRVYGGPIDHDRLRDLGVGLESTVELGWNWIRPISSAVLTFMNFLNRFIPNYGIIIIIVSVLAKLIFWPLTERSFRSMRRMQDLQPRMEEIRRRYKDDPRGMNEQIMSMYREQKVNPVGGCMPMLVQMPMFFALFSALQSSIELRNAPFFGWIDNLAGPDILYTLPMQLPVIGNHLSLLPFIMGATMVWQSKLTPSMGPTGGSQAAAMRQQQFMMRWIMPVMMTFFFYKMPSGLVIYWIVSTLMGIWQQSHINRKLGPAPVVGVVPPRVETQAAPAGAKRLVGPAGGTGARSGRAGGHGG